MIRPRENETFADFCARYREANPIPAKVPEPAIVREVGEKLYRSALACERKTRRYYIQRAADEYAVEREQWLAWYGIARRDHDGVIGALKLVAHRTNKRVWNSARLNWWIALGAILAESQMRAESRATAKIARMFVSPKLVKLAASTRSEREARSHMHPVMAQAIAPWRP